MNIVFAGFRHPHIENLYKEALTKANVVGCVEKDKKAIEDYSERVGVNFSKRSFQSFLEDNSIDAVAIGDYYGKRGQLVIEALKAGKNVICDKPICISKREIEEIESILNGSSLVLSCMLDLRYLKITNLARELLLSGELGEIRNIVFTGQHCLNYGIRPSWYFEEGKHGGTINDLGIHGVDLIRYVSNLEFDQIYCVRQWNSFATEVKNFNDCAMFIAGMENGAGVLADVSYSAPKGDWMKLPSYWNFDFWCEKGLLKLNVASDSLILYENGFHEGKILSSKEGMMISVLDDFINRINNKQGLLTNEDVVLSSKTALRLQNYGSIL